MVDFKKMFKNALLKTNEKNSVNFQKDDEGDIKQNLKTEKKHYTLADIKKINNLKIDLEIQL